MSNKGSDSRRHQSDGESSVLGQLGREIVKNPVLNRQADDWVPYVGPRGGEGWQNPETGEVVYGDMGDVAEVDESVSEPQVPEQDQAEYGESVVQVDHDDVGRGDYVHVNGEVEGYLDSVDRLQNDTVVASFENGQTVRIDSNSDVRVDDDPTPRPEDLDETVYSPDEVRESIRENINVHDAGASSRVGTEERLEVMSNDLSRCKSEEIVDRTVEGIQRVTASRGQSFYNHDDGTLNLRPTDWDETLNHETGHAIFDSNGFDTQRFSNVLALTHDRNEGVNTDVLGRPVIDVIQEIFNSGDTSISYEYLEKAEQELDGDEILDADFLDFEVSPDATEEMRELGQEVSNVFRDQLQRVQSPDFSPNQDLIVDSYAVTNVHETCAAIHEEMQRDGLSKNAMRNMYEDYPEMLDAYFDVYDPNSLQKKEIKKLYESRGPNGPIQEDPFPEVELDNE